MYLFRVRHTNFWCGCQYMLKQHQLCLKHQRQWQCMRILLHLLNIVLVKCSGYFHCPFADILSIRVIRHILWYWQYWTTSSHCLCGVFLCHVSLFKVNTATQCVSVSLQSIHRLLLMCNNNNLRIWLFFT